MSITTHEAQRDPAVPRGGRRRPPRTPKGRQVDPQALVEVRALLTDRSRRRDLLIEHLHLIQDHYGYISAAHLAALAAEMKMALTEVYEVATFYAHFDVVKEGELPPPPVTVRVCDSLSCAMAGAERLLKDLPRKLGLRCSRRARALHGGLRSRAGLRGGSCTNIQGDA
jgi:formate dehydrogenase beta subunit